MTNLKAEIEANSAKFATSWRARLDTVISSLGSEDPKFVKSYLRLVSLQAWRADLLEEIIPSGALAFFLEAQNDALLSHVLARMGHWRSALQALRSCLENVLQSLYYMDHAIELTLWNVGKHRLGFQASLKYLATHPLLDGVPLSVSGLADLTKEYSTLSRAVHGSSASFRMTTDPDTIVLLSPDVSRLNAWATRERSVIGSLNCLLLTLFRDSFSGTRRLNLRKVISFAVSEARRSKLSNKLGIVIPQRP